MAIANSGAGLGHARARRLWLLSNILDPQVAPILELAALYYERWETEGSSTRSRRT